MALLSQQVLAGRMPEAHVMENLHMACVFFTGREPPPEAIPSKYYVHRSGTETYQLTADMDAQEIRPQHVPQHRRVQQGGKARRGPQGAAERRRRCQSFAAAPTPSSCSSCAGGSRDLRLLSIITHLASSNALQTIAMSSCTKTRKRRMLMKK